MKKRPAATVAALLLLSLVLPLAACGGKPVPREISCEDIVKAYEEAGYDVVHGAHREEAEGTHRCYIKASVSGEPEGDYVYFTTWFTEEQAAEAAEKERYNPVIWFYAAISGEGRWLRSDSYGTIAYSYYNARLIEPFEELAG